MQQKIVKELEGVFKELKKEVTLKYFTQDFECRFCADTRGLIEELAGVTNKIKLEVYDFVKDKDTADRYGVDKIPGLVVMDEKDYGIKFYGIPAGYEFTSLIEAIKLVSSGEAALEPKTRQFLAGLKKDVHLQVFVTPTCPYCPKAVILAHHMAYASDKVRADMIEATEFPHLAQKYSVMGVPKTVINEKVFQEGAAPEQLLVQKIKDSTK